MSIFYEIEFAKYILPYLRAGNYESTRPAAADETSAPDDALRRWQLYRQTKASVPDAVRPKKLRYTLDCKSNGWRDRWYHSPAND